MVEAAAERVAERWERLGSCHGGEIEGECGHEELRIGVLIDKELVERGKK